MKKRPQKTSQFVILSAAKNLYLVSAHKCLEILRFAQNDTFWQRNFLPTFLLKSRDRRYCAYSICGACVDARVSPGRGRLLDRGKAGPCEKYALAYSTILGNQPNLDRYLYIDGFAGAGVHLSKRTGEYIPGSPLNALNVNPPFSEYHFIDLDGGRADLLRQLSSDRNNVWVYEADCNQVLIDEVFPRARWEDYRRALCLLDPYGLHLEWKVIHAAGQMKSIEIFLNFPIMDINMNVLKKDPSKIDTPRGRWPRLSID